MKFALINSSGYVDSIHNRKEAFEALKEAHEPGDDRKIQPIMTLAEFNATSTDFRGLLCGRPSMIYLDPESGGTVLGYVYLIEGWDAIQNFRHFHRYSELIV